MKKEKKQKDIQCKFFKFATTDNEEQVKKLIEVLKDYYGERIVYIGAFKHNQDIYDKYDELENKEHEAGTKKKNHIHFSIVFNKIIRLSQLQKIIVGVLEDENRTSAGFICLHNQKPKSNKTYLYGMCNMIDYWFHRGTENKHKHQYSIKNDLNNLVYFENFNWKMYFEYLGIQNKEEHLNNESYMKDDWSKETKIYDDIENGRMSINWLKINDGAFYQKHQRELEKRANMFIETQPIPKSQTAIFITGNQSGIGKSCFSSALGEAFSKQNIYEVIEDGKAMFGRYKAEDTIIFNDTEHSTFSNIGKKKLKTWLDRKKPRAVVDKKFGDVFLKNRFWIFNSIRSWEDNFIFKLKDEDGNFTIEDVDNTSQYTRRINMIQLCYFKENNNELRILIQNRTRDNTHYLSNSESDCCLSFENMIINDEDLSNDNINFYYWISKQLESCFDYREMKFDISKLKQLKQSLQEKDFLNVMNVIQFIHNSNEYKDYYEE